MKSAPNENEHYVTHSNRITGVVVIAIGVLGWIDIIIEWRSLAGLTAAAVIGALMVVTYVGLIRPSIVLTPELLRIRNHIRDHDVPWSLVESADIADIVVVQTPGKRLRAPGVQLIMRDMRKQRVRGSSGADDSVSRAGFVVERIEQHAERYAKTSTGQISSRWATPELAALAGLIVLATVTWILH
ncbi:PH domain-containing protein [Kribbella deserti]|uniref:PH domain-containing protein n=1 Tax=Kribbella deserti TaxID=1926257 RepID=A0ABV6QRV2_9ACTN